MTKYIASESGLRIKGRFYKRGQELPKGVDYADLIRRGWVTAEVSAEPVRDAVVVSTNSNLYKPLKDAQDDGTESKDEDTRPRIQHRPKKRSRPK